MRLEGRIVKGIGGFYYVNVGDEGLYECRAKGIFRNRGMKPNVGDHVEIDVISDAEKTGNLSVIRPRKNQLIRPMVSNVDQAMVIFAVKDPQPDFHLLNRFLVTMCREDIPVILCFNKMDLAGPGIREELREAFRGAGCTIHFLSASLEEGVHEIEEALLGKTTVLAGPSGVGKSSTLNCLSLDKQMETGDLSRKIKRGRHTTRHSELIYLGKDTYLMDTPGFSSLYLPEMEKEELRHYFPEFRPYENRCRFNGCCHIHEPDCKVKEALDEGLISRLRYEDYVLFYGEIAQKKKW